MPGGFVMPRDVSVVNLRSLIPGGLTMPGAIGSLPVNTRYPTVRPVKTSTKPIAAFIGLPYLDALFKAQVMQEVSPAYDDKHDNCYLHRRYPRHSSGIACVLALSGAYLWNGSPGNI